MRTLILGTHAIWGISVGGRGAQRGLRSMAPVADKLEVEVAGRARSSVQGEMPRHVAIIMDGNGRWAAQRSMPRSAGHRHGVEAVRRTVRAALEFGIEYLTVYSFSSENWTRPKAEVGYLLDLLRRFVDKDVGGLHANGVRVKVIGDRAPLEPDLISLIEHSEWLTRANTAMTLIVAFNYGGRSEITRAVQSIARAVRAGQIDAERIAPETVSMHLDTGGIPDPDLVIRTSGEQRLSNFLLWQSAYAEFVFVAEHWPDFGKEILARALDQYMHRDRRFGCLTASVV
jgi:undecaprenyl diphosphate synthase